MRPVVLLLVVVAGCYQPSPPSGAACANGQCPSGLRCVDGICISGDPTGDAQTLSDACGIPARCEGEVLVDCEASTPCTLGCSSAGEAPHCRALVPSNGITPALLDGATANVIADKLDFDTTDGRIKTANIVIREPGEGVRNGIGFYIIDGMGVFTAASMTVPTGEGWTGGGPNTWVLYSATTITVLGELDAGASLNAGGPGGKNGGSTASTLACRGGAGKAYTGSFGEGGGGAGGATTGGNGAPANMTTFGVGGTACGQPSTIPLRGGNGGGAGGVDSVNGSLRGGFGGGGGGGVALVAMGTVTVDGRVGVPGGGGDGRTNGDGGGGGGGGGAILVEAPLVTINGALTANGGGGGGPSSTDGNRGAMASANAAAGGLFNGKRGGQGGAGTLAPTNGETYDDGLGTMRRGGGGGGSVGVIEIKAVVPVVMNGAVTSPPAKTSSAVVQ